MTERSGRARATMQIRHDSAGSDPITVGPDKTINVNFSKLTAPPNVYDADLAWIARRGADVSLFFGKRNFDEQPKALRSRLQVRYPVECFLSHFWKNSRTFHQRLRETVKMWPAELAQPSDEQPGTFHAERDHSEWVTFDAIAISGSAAMMDFYLLPAIGVARFSTGQGSAGLTVVPIVRVQLNIFELLHLLDSAAGMIDEIEKLVPTKELERRSQ